MRAPAERELDKRKGGRGKEETSKAEERKTSRGRNDNATKIPRTHARTDSNTSSNTELT